MGIRQHLVVGTYRKCVLLSVVIENHGVWTALSKTCLVYLCEVLDKYVELYFKFFSL